MEEQIMKKIYLQPHTDIFKVEIDQIMVVSGGEESKSASVNGDYTPDGGITLGARRSTLWSDDDE